MLTEVATTGDRITGHAPPADLLSRFEGVRSTGDGQWEAHCPCPGHDDRRCSLSIGTGDDGRTLLNCHAGCSNSDVVVSVGLTMADLFPKSKRAGSHLGKSKSKTVATYDYRDEAGKLLFQVCRMEPKDFRQRKPDGSGGWIWSTKGVRRVLYRLLELLAADSSEVVFVVEGEDDVDLLRSMGLVAVCNPGGAGKWRSEFADFLKGRHVVVIADNDDAGRKHAQQVARSLVGKAASIKVVELLGLPAKGDVSDWLRFDGRASDLLTLVDETDEWKPTSADESPESNSERQGRNACPAHSTFDDRESDEMTANLLAPDGRTDLANSRLFAHLFRESVRYCHVWKKWLAWDGRRWKSDTSGTVIQFAKGVADRIWDIARTHDNTSLLRHAANTASARGLKAMLELAASSLSIESADLDQQPLLLNCLNGTVDLATSDIQSHRPDDLITKLCPTNFDPTAKADTWLRFLRDVFLGDDELIAFVQRFLGYCLTGDVSEHVLAIAYGVGANGKSTLFETFMHILGGDYASKAPRDLMLAKRNDSHPTAVADLHGMRFVAATETGAGRCLDEALVKEMTGGDTLRARRMREDYWSFRPSHKLVLSTNHRPRIKGVDNGIWRRLRLIPFDRVFDETEQDKRLPEKLQAEAPGILAWCVRGCLEWQQSGLGMPAAVSAATSQYRNDSDVIGQFIAECCVVGEQYRVKFSEMWNELERFVEDVGDESPSKRAVSKYLKDKGFTRKQSNGIHYFGVGLKAE